MRKNSTDIRTNLLVSDHIQENEKEQINQWLENLIKDTILVPAESLNKGELNAIAKKWFPDAPKSDSSEKKAGKVNEDKEEKIEGDVKSSVTVVENEETEEKKEEPEAQNVEVEKDTEDTEIDKKEENDKATEEKGKEKIEEKDDPINPATRLVTFASKKGINLKALDEEGQGKIKALIEKDLITMEGDKQGTLKEIDVERKKAEWEQYLQKKTAQKLTPAELEKLYKFATKNEKKYLLYNLDSRLADNEDAKKDESVEAELKELANALNDEGQFSTGSDLTKSSDAARNANNVEYKWREPRQGNFLQDGICTLDSQDYKELSIAEEFKIKQFINNLDDFDDKTKRKLILFAIQEKLLVYNLEGDDVNTKLKNLAELLEIESEGETKTEAEVVEFKEPTAENKENESAETTWSKLGGLKHELMQAAKQLVKLDFIPKNIQQEEKIGDKQQDKIKELLKKIFPDNDDKETKNNEKISKLVLFAERYDLPLQILESKNINPMLFKPDLEWIIANLSEDNQIKFKQFDGFKTKLNKWSQHLTADANIGRRMADEAYETFAEKIEKHMAITPGMSANLRDAEIFRTNEKLDEIKQVDNLNFVDGIPALPHAYTYVGTPLIQDQFYNLAFHQELLKILDDHKKAKVKPKEDKDHRKDDPLVLTYWVRPNKQDHWQRFEMIIPKGNISKRNKIKIVHYDPLSKPEGYDSDDQIKKQLDKEIKDAFLEAIQCALTAEHNHIEMIENTVYEGIQPKGTNICLGANVFKTFERTGRTDHSLIKAIGDLQDSGMLTSNQAATLQLEFVKGCLDKELRKNIELVVRNGKIVDQYRRSPEEWNEAKHRSPKIQKEILDDEEAFLWTTKEKGEGSSSPYFSDLQKFVNEVLKEKWGNSIQCAGISLSREEQIYTVSYKITSLEAGQPTECNVVRQRSDELDKPGVKLTIGEDTAKTMNIETQLKILASTAYADRRKRALPNEKIIVQVTELNPPGEKYLNLLKQYLAELGCDFFQGPHDAAPIALERPASASPTEEDSASVTKVPSPASAGRTPGFFSAPSASSVREAFEGTKEETTDEEETDNEEAFEDGIEMGEITHT